MYGERTMSEMFEVFQRKSSIPNKPLIQWVHDEEECSVWTLIELDKFRPTECAKCGVKTSEGVIGAPCFEKVYVENNEEVMKEYCQDCGCSIISEKGTL
jgi:hypothetical protein